LRPAACNMPILRRCQKRRCYLSPLSSGLHCTLCLCVLLPTLFACALPVAQMQGRQGRQGRGIDERRGEERGRRGEESITVVAHLAHVPSVATCSPNSGQCKSEMRHPTGTSLPGHLKHPYRCLEPNVKPFEPNAVTACVTADFECRAAARG